MLNPRGEVDRRSLMVKSIDFSSLSIYSGEHSCSEMTFGTSLDYDACTVSSLTLHQVPSAHLDAKIGLVNALVRDTDKIAACVQLAR